MPGPHPANMVGRGSGLLGICFIQSAFESSNFEWSRKQVCVRSLSCVDWMLFSSCRTRFSEDLSRWTHRTTSNIQIFTLHAGYLSSCRKGRSLLPPLSIFVPAFQNSIFEGHDDWFPAQQVKPFVDPLSIWACLLFCRCPTKSIKGACDSTFHKVRIW